MDFQLPGRDVPPPQFGTPQPVQQQLTPEQLAAVNGNGPMPMGQPQQYGAPQQDGTSQPAYDPTVKQGQVAPPINPNPTGFLTDSQTAIANAMKTNPGAGYLQRGLGGAPAPSSQLQGVAQQIRPPPMLRANPQPNRIAGFPAYRMR